MLWSMVHGPHGLWITLDTLLMALPLFMPRLLMFSLSFFISVLIINLQSILFIAHVFVCSFDLDLD